VIFWSLHFARQGGSEYIEPEHILEGLLREDPQIFQLILSQKPDLVESLKNDLVSRRQAIAFEPKATLPLSPSAKVVVLQAGNE
jgi:ATP-dependent Clp protease ATP-binding subunit ClpA